MLTKSRQMATAVVVAAVAACSGGSDTSDDAQPGASSPTVKHRGDVKQVTSVDQALPGVFVQPFEDCRAPTDGVPGKGPGGKVCTNVAISAATELGRYFPDYASCAVVRTQRPYWPNKPANQPDPKDPRLSDPKFVAELKWVTEQFLSTACTCCHDSRQAPMGPSQWIIDAPGVWTDTISDRGLELFTGLGDSTILGAYPPDQNHGFERVTAGVPTTDGPRMRDYFLAEAARRGISKEKLSSGEPFASALHDAWIKPPPPCANGEGVDANGAIHWNGPRARYVYVIAEGSKAPAVPPNLDTPEGTLWRLDVLASEPPLDRGFAYGTTPAGSFQAVPAQGNAPPLVKGTRYRIWVGQDVALPITNCLFEYGGG